MHRAVSIKAVLAAAIVMMSSAAAIAAVPGWATGAVNVRIAPGTHNPRVDRLVPGEWVEIVECQAGWCYIQHQGPDGWVSANYLAKREAGPTPFPNPGNQGHPLPPNGNPGPFPPLPNHGQGHPLPPNGNPGPFPPFPNNGPIGQPLPPNGNPGPFPPFPYPGNVYHGAEPFSGFSGAFSSL